MGLIDKAKQLGAAAEHVQAAAQTPASQPGTTSAGASPPPSASTGRCPGNHYVTEVNKGSINMGRWQAHLNDMYGRGYRLSQVFEQDGNTVQVFEHHFHK